MTTRTFTFNVTAPVTQAWRNQPQWAWAEIPNSAISTAMIVPQNGIYAYCGGALDTATSNLYLTGGGHSNGYDNNWYRLNLNNGQTAQWTRLSTPTPFAQIPWAGSDRGHAYYLDGRPASRHTWSHTTAFFPNMGAQGRVVCFGANSVYGRGDGLFPTLDAFDVATNDWSWINPTPVALQDGPNPNFPPFPTGALDGVSGGVMDVGRNCWWGHAYSGGVGYRRYNSALTTGGAVGAWDLSVAVGYSEGRRYLVHDTTRDRIIALPGGADVPTITYWSAATGSMFPQVSWPVGNPAIATGQSGAVYDPDLDKIVIMRTGPTDMWLMDPTTFAMTPVTVSGSPLPLPSVLWGSDRGYETADTKMRYVPALKGVIYFNWYTSNVTFMRTAPR